MFTGIIETLGTIKELRKEGEIAKAAQNHGVSGDACQGKMTLGQ